MPKLRSLGILVMLVLAEGEVLEEGAYRAVFGAGFLGQAFVGVHEGPDPGGADDQREDLPEGGPAPDRAQRPCAVNQGQHADE